MCLAIGLSHYGETIADFSQNGDYVEVEAGAQDDRVVHMRYGVIDQCTTTQLVNSPHIPQLNSWAKNRTKLTFQATDENTGEKVISTSAYILNRGNRKHGEPREYTFVFGDPLV